MARARTRPLSRKRVLRAAITRADKGGIDSLSMRKLADGLGVKAMSLYKHVANKDDLLDGMLDAVFAEFDLPGPGTEWKTGVRGIAISAHETLVRHAWAAGLWSSQKPGAARLRYGNALLGCFRDAGFSKEVTYHAYHIIESYILGYTFQVLGFGQVDPEQLAGVATAFLTGDFAAEYPNFYEHVLQHLQPDSQLEEESGYEIGLDLILAGLEPLRGKSGQISPSR
jgi:AcrR family transcriptional regulator